MTARHSVRRVRGDDGVSLILAMAFLSLLGVLVASLLTVSFSSIKTTTSVRGSNTGLYAADGGADVAVQLLRASSSYCPDAAAGTQALPSQTVGGRTVSLSCQTLSGSTGGGSGGGGYGSGWPTSWAFVLTGYNGGQSNETFKTSGSTGQNITATFQGKTFNAGGFSWAGGSDKFVFDSVDQYDPYCTNNKPGTTGKPTVTGAWTCRSSGSFAVPDPNPTLIVPTAAAPAPVTQGTCTIFFPGRYTSDPTFDKDGSAYLASGVYYFDNRKIQFNGKVFGGQQSPGEPKNFTGNTPCSNDTAAQALAPSAAINGYGVQLVAGGSTTIEWKSDTKTQIELFARVPGVPANEGTPYISIFAPKTSGPNYTASSANDVIKMGGSAYKGVNHGLVYAPNARPKFWGIDNAPAGGAPFFSGGVVFADMELAINATMTTQTFSMLPTPVAAPATDRTVVVTATATTGSGGEVTQTVRAVLLYPASGGAPTVLSWRKV